MNNSYFSKYGKDFQEKIFQALLTDHTWSGQMFEVMKYDYFELKYLQFLCDRFFGFYEKYKNFPTLQLLITIIKDDLTTGNDIILRDQVIDYLTRMKASPNLGDLKFVKDKSLDFCKKQSLQQALEESVKAIKAENYEQVLSIMKDAVYKGSPSTIGHNFFEDHESRFVLIDRSTCPTGIPQLDNPPIQYNYYKGSLAIKDQDSGCPDYRPNYPCLPSTTGVFKDCGPLGYNECNLNINSAKFNEDSTANINKDRQTNCN